MEIRPGDGNARWEPLPDLPKAASPFDDGLVDLHSLANSIFVAEKHVLQGGNAALTVGIPLRNGLSKELRDALEALFTLLYGSSPTFEARPTQPSLEPEMKVEWSEGYVSLFSCGMDSTSGITSARKLFPVRGIMTLHPDFPNLVSTMRRLNHNVLEPRGIELRVVHAPYHGGMTRLTRGFLYVANAGLFHTRNIIISEVGPTMYQPKFTLLDEVARTTDPQVLARTKQIIKLVTGENVNLLRSSESLTKAEAGRAAAQPDILKETTSCASTRFISSMEPHCGSCYACVVRRLAFSILGLKDRPYYRTGFSGGGADNTAHLIRFSLDFLTNPKSIPPYTLENIERYHKDDLFRRFALDNLAGLILTPDSGYTLQRKLTNLVLSKLDKGVLEERVERVRGGHYSLDFQNQSLTQLQSNTAL